MSKRYKGGDGDMLPTAFPVESIKTFGYTTTNVQGNVLAGDAWIVTQTSPLTTFASASTLQASSSAAGKQAGLRSNDNLHMSSTDPSNVNERQTSVSRCCDTTCQLSASFPGTNILSASSSSRCPFSTSSSWIQSRSCQLWKSHD